MLWLSLWLLGNSKLYLINRLVEFNPDDKSLANRLTGRSIQLQVPAALCLLYLITHRGNVVSQHALMEAGWGERNDITTPNTFYQAILTLRNALEDVGLSRDTVKTISRRGLTLAEATTVEEIYTSGIPGQSIAAGENTYVASTLSEESKKRLPAWLNMSVLVLCLITLINVLGVYQNRLKMPFRNFIPFSMHVQSEKNCKIYYEPNEVFLDNYFLLIKRNPEFCVNNNSIFLSGYSKAERIVAFVCNKDAREDAKALCTTHFYWTRKK